MQLERSGFKNTLRSRDMFQGCPKLSSMNCDAASQRRIHTSAIRHCGPVFPLFVVLLVMPIGKTVFVSQGRSNLMCQDPAHCFEQMEARLSVETALRAAAESALVEKQMELARERRMREAEAELARERRMREAEAKNVSILVSQNRQPDHLCIIVAFRDGCGWHGNNRSSQLEQFLDYMTAWLGARGHSSFRFFVSEQSQRGLFNKGLLFNLGALQAFSEGCEHLVFHDVDQHPEHPENDYFYHGHPTHLCTYSTSFNEPRSRSRLRLHVGGALLMSRSDYQAVNGFSNQYWRWGLEDDDMYFRIYSAFDHMTRLPQEVGSYKAVEHHRQAFDVYKASDAYKASLAHLNKMQGDIVEARTQMASDGLDQACLYGEFLRIDRHPSRRLVILTSDLFDSSPCMDAMPNKTKTELEDRHRDQGGGGSCVSTLKDARLQPTIIPRIRLCTAHHLFCIKLWSSHEILHKTMFFDLVTPMRRGRETSDPTQRPTDVSTACKDYDQMTSATQHEVAGFLGLVDGFVTVTADVNQSDNLHGDNHPSVSISWGHPPLVYKYDSDGALLSMEINGWIDGCLSNFEYALVVVHNAFPSADAEQWMDKNIYEKKFKKLHGVTLPFTAVFAKPEESDKHRFIVKLIDLGSDVALEQRIIAGREGTFPVSLRCPSAKPSLTPIHLLFNASLPLHDHFPSRSGGTSATIVSVELSRCTGYENHVQRENAFTRSACTLPGAGCLTMDDLINGSAHLVDEAAIGDHPPVSIKWGEPALVYKHNSSGALQTIEINAWIKGCLADLEYLIRAAEISGDMGFTAVTTHATPVSVLQAPSSFHITVVFPKPEKRDRHRIMLWVLDRRSLITAGAETIAKREGTFVASLRCPSVTSPKLDVGHPFMMGWNESMAYLRMLIRQKVAFSVARYGDGELEILSNRTHHNKEWSWSPVQHNAGKFRLALMQPFTDAQSADNIMMVGLPVPFCAEGYVQHMMGGGGRTDLLDKFFEHLAVRNVPSNRLLYSWQFGNLNYNATQGLIRTLREAEWPIWVVCNHARTRGNQTPDWVDIVLTVSNNNIEDMMSDWDLITGRMRNWALAVNKTAFLFAAGPISNVVISMMHRTNPRNIYIDVGGSLDYILSNDRTRDFHPADGDPNHFIRAGGALIHGQNCTETRYVITKGRLIPVTDVRI